MSTEKKRPQLETNELQQLKWLLGGALALVALSSLFYLEIDALPLMILGFVLVPLAILKPHWPARVPALLHRLVFPAVVAFAVYDFYTHGETLPALARLDVLLLLYRACSYRKRRDDLQLIVLGLFLIVMAGVITVSLAFAVQIIAFVACALLLLFVVTLVDAQESGAVVRDVAGIAPSWTKQNWLPLFRRLRETCDWRVFALGGLLFAGFVLLSGALFLAIPRFQLETSLFLDRLITRKSSTGFSDTLKFTDVTDIQQDDSVALRVEISDRNQVPSVLYWRLVVLDEYRNGAFQMSAALKSAAFRREETASRINGSEPPPQRGAPQWTFYLEPGVGRYLPLTGSFRRLVFTEPQIFRASTTLQLVMLSRDPVAMKAYRVDGMRTSEQPADPAPENLSHEGIEARKGIRGPDWLGTGLGEKDKAVLDRTVAEITKGGALKPEEFARKATLWLAGRHRYSLRSELPSGDGDPLVRWLVSREPGHCELFAGAFAVLARAAGYPTRLVAGFLGGTWNGDYLIVRNSDAHAWCEISDRHGHWLRVDPTNDGPRFLAESQSTESAATNLRTIKQGWASRFDRLRMLWYRRIVNFDRTEQQKLINVIQSTAEGSGRQIRDWALHVVSKLRQWVMQPWDFRRWGTMAGIVIFGGTLAFVWWRFWRFWWASWRRARSKDLNPTRREAGRWLRKIERWEATENALVVRAKLERLRYGSPESWSEPEKVFREARSASRTQRKRSAYR